MVKRSNPKKKQIMIYVFTVIFSVVYIVVGRYIAMQGYPDLGEQDEAASKARVTEIVSVTEVEHGEVLVFSATLLNGPQKGESVLVSQTLQENYYPWQDAVSVGDKVLIYRGAYGVDTEWGMLEYVRFDYLLWLLAAFCLVILLFGRFKGVNTLVSLAFTCLAVFCVFLPSVLSGQNIYLWATVTCLYIIVMTMLFINGANKKSFAAGMGCFSGVLAAGVITMVMDHVMKLTGRISEDTLYLQIISDDVPIDLRAIIFAAIVIGAVGAIMDVAMDIASSLNEIRCNIPDASAKLLIRSGFNIGRDVMGTMANTLVLAYIGSSLSTTLLFVTYNVAAVELFNMELIVVEILQALAGSFGILLSIPLTSFICAAIYPRKEQAAPPQVATRSVVGAVPAQPRPQQPLHDWPANVKTYGGPKND